MAALVKYSDLRAKQHWKRLCTVYRTTIGKNDVWIFFCRRLYVRRIA